MLANLKFVQGAIRRNVIAPELEHYQIINGRVTGFNGHMALSAPVDLDLTAYPRADLFYKALEACQDSVSMDMTGNGRLAIRSGGFRAFIPCLESVSFDIKPAGDEFPSPPGLVDDMRMLLPFISEDASRPWSMGLLVADGCYTATNNVTLIQKWSGHGLPRFNFPRFAVAELVRNGVDPITIQSDGNSVSFHYGDGRWLRTQLYSDAWPYDKLNSVMSADDDAQPLTEGFAEAVTKIAPFTEEKGSHIYFTGEGLATDREDGVGVRVALEGLPDGPVFSVHQLKLISGVAEKVDWLLYPNPCIFYGDNLRGCIMGMSR